MHIRSVIVSVVVALAATALVFAQDKQGDTRGLQGEPAPEFELQTLDGQTVKLADMKGNVVVLDFWATWCGPCVAAMPHLQEMANNDEYRQKGLKVFAVNLREADEKVKGFIEQNGYTFIVPMDREGSTATAYKVRAIPTQVVIGRDGKVARVFVGDGGKKLNEAVEEALAAKAPGTARGPAEAPAEASAR